MAYLSATLGELNYLLPGRLEVTASSTPAVPAAQAIINGISAELDSAAAAAGYSVPVSTIASYAYGLLQNYAGLGAAWRVLSVMMPNQGGPKDVVALSSQYRDSYERALEQLRAGTLVLTGAARDDDGSSGGRILPRSYSTSNPGATSGVTPQVTMRRDQF